MSLSPQGILDPLNPSIFNLPGKKVASPASGCRYPFGQPGCARRGTGLVFIKLTARGQTDTGRLTLNK